MSDCTSLEPLFTPYVDGDIDAASRLRVDDHVRRCPPCQSRVAAERAVRELVRARRADICSDAASAALRARCLALRAAAAGGAAELPSFWRSRIKPLAVAASVILVAGGVFVYEATDRSTRVLAAELTADHVKCFGMNSLIGANADAAAADGTMVSTFGWHMPLPEAAQRAGMELLGARVCLYGRGLAAHIMYRHNGQPVSVFMIPKMTRADAVLDVMGHEAAIWSSGGRTFVLVAREPEDEMSRMTAIVQAAVH